MVSGIFDDYQNTFMALMSMGGGCPTGIDLTVSKTARNSIGVSPRGATIDQPVEWQNSPERASGRSTPTSGDSGIVIEEDWDIHMGPLNLDGALDNNEIELTAKQVRSLKGLGGAMLRPTHYKLDGNTLRKATNLEWIGNVFRSFFGCHTFGALALPIINAIPERETADVHTQIIAAIRDGLKGEHFDVLDGLVDSQNMAVSTLVDSIMGTSSSKEEFVLLLMPQKTAEKYEGELGEAQRNAVKTALLGTYGDDFDYSYDVHAISQKLSTQKRNSEAGTCALTQGYYNDRVAGETGVFTLNGEETDLAATIRFVYEQLENDEHWQIALELFLGQHPLTAFTVASERAQEEGMNLEVVAQADVTFDKLADGQVRVVAKIPLQLRSEDMVHAYAGEEYSGTVTYTLQKKGQKIIATDYRVDITV
jgi:hypothetical protein